MFFITRKAVVQTTIRIIERIIFEPCVNTGTETFFCRVLCIVIPGLGALRGESQTLKAIDAPWFEPDQCRTPPDRCSQVPVIEIGGKVLQG